MNRISSQYIFLFFSSSFLFTISGYQDWWHFVDSFGGFQRMGGLGTAVITAGIGLFNSKPWLNFFGPSAHQNSCFCDYRRGDLIDIEDTICVMIPESVLRAAESSTPVMRYSHPEHGRFMWQCWSEAQLREAREEGIKCDIVEASASSKAYKCEASEE